MDRRTLLKTLLLLPFGGTFGELIAAPITAAIDSPKLLFVFLRGGYDAANVLVPISSDFYYQSRPTIAIARPSSDVHSALPINSDWGLHPALKETIYPLYKENQALFIPFAGTEDVSRSHFETQDSISLGQPSNQSKNYRSGFLNRLVEEVTGKHPLSPLSFTNQLPIIFQGNIKIPNVPLRSIGKTQIDTHQSSLIASMYKDTSLYGQVNEGFNVRNEVMHELSAEMESSGRNAISAKGFELEARRIARLMKENYGIGFIDIGGWDTHVGEGAGTGYLAGRLDELGRGLSGFSQEMGNQWKNTVVIVISEFGRTFRENGNKGTDHGHGCVYWVLGGSIKGGQIAGEQQKIEASTLFQNRDFPVLNEYRGILGNLFGRMYGLHSDQLARIFPNSKLNNLNII